MVTYDHMRSRSVQIEYVERRIEKPVPVHAAGQCAQKPVPTKEEKATEKYDCSPFAMRFT